VCVCVCVCVCVYLCVCVCHNNVTSVSHQCHISVITV
jgi:hypothetical protein